MEGFWKWRRKSAPPLALTFLCSIVASRAENVTYFSDSEMPNCFMHIHENAWQKTAVFDSWAATINVYVNNTGPRVLSCLEDQKNVTALPGIYQISLVRKQRGNRNLVSEPEYFTPLALTMPNNVIQFKYVLFKGSYRVQFRICEFKHGKVDQNDNGAFRDCGQHNVTESVTIRVSKNHPIKAWCAAHAHSRHSNDSFSKEQDIAGTRDYVKVSQPILTGRRNTSLRFDFSYTPCSDEVFSYEGAMLTIYSTYKNTSDACQLAKNATLRGKLTGEKTSIKLVAQSQFDVKAKLASENSAQISYITSALEGDKFYCAVVESNHVLCQRNRQRLRRHHRQSHRHNRRSGRRRQQRRQRRMADEELPEFCVMSSDLAFVPDKLPFISSYLPFCTSHFKCGWLYILVVGSICFLSSCLLAVCFVQCCCRRKKQPRRAEDQQTFDTLCLNEEEEKIPRKSWSQMHDEFYADPPKNPGKILLLYSPDSKQFKELQKSFRNFLEMACHCVVLDLFDEQLFQTICYDPEQWLSNLLKDRHFKIIIVCSEGAFKRQQALVKGEVLNIPKVNSSLDGLFSAGLKFIQERHAYDRNRLTLVRYDNLTLTRPEYKLTMMSSGGPGGTTRMTTSEVDDFLVPNQLPDLFCWIHNYQGEAYAGRPWDRYHLELQLLQDDLKQARAERRISKA